VGCRAAADDDDEVLNTSTKLSARTANHLVKIRAGHLPSSCGPSMCRCCNGLRGTLL
jgi:hypothetical protein